MLCEKRQKYRYLSVFLGALALSGCGFDPTAEQHDRTRWEELQKTDCGQVAGLASQRLIAGKSGDSYEVILERCRKMRALTWEQYKAAAQQARETGEWPYEQMPAPAPADQGEQPPPSAPAP